MIPEYDFFGIPILSGDMCGDPYEDRLDVANEMDEQEREDDRQFDRGSEDD